MFYNIIYKVLQVCKTFNLLLFYLKYVKNLKFVKLLYYFSIVLVLLTMARLIEEHYSPALISSNIHLSLHIKQCCLDYGPPYTYWCYSFKRINGLLGK